MRQIGAWLASLAMLIQLFAPPAHRMTAPMAGERVASQLRAAFGDVATLCIQADNGDAPTTPRDHSCDDQCPLCQANAPPLALLAEPTIAPTRLVLGLMAPIPSGEDVVIKPARATLAQARAPPFQG